MTNQEQNAHLLRRFGLGASKVDREAVADLTPSVLMDRLLDVTPVDGPLNPLRFAFLRTRDAEPNAYRFRNFWVYEMLTTKQPLREKMSVFWHNHFAVTDNKIEDGLAILEYLQIIRKNPLGKFSDILKAMSKSVAVMKTLDVQMLSKAKPNENFAREVLELYTLGVGNYTEQDIQQLARLLTGWGYVSNFYQLGKTNNNRLQTMMENQSWPSAYAYIPAYHDDTPRQLLGETASSTDEVLELLARHPKTAESLCTKLWKYFGSPDVNQNAVNAMIKTWHRTDGHIGSVLKTMSETPEFWSDSVIKSLPKSPIDFVVGIARAQNAGMEAEMLHDHGEYNKPVPEALDGMLAEAANHMKLMGFDLLYVPSVAGYEGGREWINPEFFVRKLNYGGLRQYVPFAQNGKVAYRPGRTSKHVISLILNAKPKTTHDYALAICDVYDVVLNEKQLKDVVAILDKRGGIKTLGNENAMVPQIAEAFKIIRVTPAFNLI